MEVPMRAGLLAAVAILIIAFCAYPVAAQDDEINLEIFGSARRPAVVFPHALHVDLLECTICHHDYDALGNNTNSEGRACTDCHGAADDPSAEARAFHRLCLGCHAKESIQLKYDPPVMCGQCHVKVK